VGQSLIGISLRLTGEKIPFFWLIILVSMNALRVHLHAAVTELHSHGVHYHDLKHENIVRRQDGKLTLIDFHLSEILDESSCPPNTCPDWRWI
jgi:serine/threonine protein kinase